MKYLRPSVILFLFLLLVPGTFAAPADWRGQPLPEASITYLDAVPSFQGKVVLLEFWASWCPHCRHAISRLNDVAREYQGRGMVIAAVTQEGADVIERFRMSTPMNYALLSDPTGALFRRLGIQSIPHAFLVDKNGLIVWQGNPAEFNTSLLESALK